MLGQQRSKTLLPLTYGFMGELEAAQQKYLGNIPQALLEVRQRPARGLHRLGQEVAYRAGGYASDLGLWLWGLLPRRHLNKCYCRRYRSLVDLTELSRLTKSAD